jgi:hypothetical protein
MQQAGRNAARDIGGIFNWGNGVLTGKQQYPIFNVVEVFQQIKRVSFPVEKP